MNRLALLVALTVLLPASEASGMIVSDPTSYTYMIEQITKYEKQIEQMAKTAEKATVTADKLTAMKNQLEGNYNRVAGLADRLTKVAKRMEQVPYSLESDVLKIQKKLGTNEGRLNDGDMTEWESLDLHVDGVFGDPRDPNWNPWKVNEQKYEVRQGVLRNSLKQSTLRLHGLKKRMDELKTLFDEIDRTKNIKDSQDLTNRLFAELLVGQQEMIELLAHMAQATAVMKYKGMTKKGAQASAATALKRKATKSAKEALMKSLGVHSGMSSKEFEKRMGM